MVDSHPPGHTPKAGSTPPPPGFPRLPRANRGSPAPWLITGGALVLGVAMLVATINIVGGADDRMANASSQDGTSTSGVTPGDVPPTGDDGSNDASGDGIGSTSELDVSLPFENQPCTGAYVLLLTSSGDPTTYESTVERGLTFDSSARYLNAAESCEGFIQTIDGNVVYASYAGVYDSLSTACDARRSIGDRRPVVVQLDSDKTTNRPLCVCLEDATNLPVLSGDTSSDPSTEDELDIVNLQSALARGGYATPKVPGRFDKVTEDSVRDYQEENGLTVDGFVASETWQSILDNWC